MSLEESFLAPSDTDVISTLDDARTRIRELESDVRELEETNRRLRRGLVAQCRCRRFKGLHENDYSDCIVVCSLFGDDYVSRAHCQTCGDYEILMKKEEK